ncbi:DUF3077 domain-containing protein [Thiocystis violacea]|uniref:DUF3077 domain-containing protein n=1 Tax=Thiocystis violacea TaxID=13725 RepID=UPI001903B546|nr:DUF3077 domain-containing protein [Thiocystis violacea]
MSNQTTRKISFLPTTANNDLLSVRSGVPIAEAVEQASFLLGAAIRAAIEA